MLTRCFSALVGMLVLLTIAAPSAFADGVSCPNGQQYNAFTMTCFIAVSVPGSQGAAQAAPVAVVDQGGSVSACMDTSFGRNEPVPCESEFGWWSADMKCYVQLADPQPAKSGAVWQGNTDGAIYSCRIGSPGAWNPFGLFWSASMPVDPAVVAQSIVEQMELRAITIGMVPEDRPGSLGVVGLPLWMWVRVFCLGHGRTVERPL